MPHPVDASRFESWHELLDALCLSKGHADNSKLASDLCELAGTGGEAAYVSAFRNLANWRNGRHIPRRPNFLHLTNLLAVGEDPVLEACWNTLYSEAQAKGGNGTGSEAEVVHPVPLAGRFSRIGPRAVVGLAAAALVIVAVGGFLYFSDTFYGLAAIGRDVKEGPATIRHQFYVSLKVGETALIHGARADCGEAPPPWEKVGPGLPELTTGEFFDGGLGKRFSRACGGLTPARAVMFRATAPGKDQFRLFGDLTTIEVE